MKLESHSYCAALFARSYVKIFNSQKMEDGHIQNRKVAYLSAVVELFCKNLA